jgi:hypothetical protein
MFTKLAIWYLRKRKKSVLIGYNVKNGTIRAIENDAYSHDNVFRDCEFELQDGRPYTMLDKVDFIIRGKSK